jgi:hypothetical protein
MNVEGEISALSKDAHIVIGDVPLVLPLIAISGQAGMGASFTLDNKNAGAEWEDERDSFRQAADDPTTAPSLKSLEVVIYIYGWHGDEDVPLWMKMCPQLRPEWARAICDTNTSPILKSLPQRFTFVDGRDLDNFGWTTVGGEEARDHVRAITFMDGQTSLICDRKRSEKGVRHCTAAIQAGKHLLVVWSVSDQPDRECAEAKANREGRALIAFVSLGLGPVEDFSALTTTLQSLQRPEREAANTGNARQSCES